MTKAGGLGVPARAGVRWVLPLAAALLATALLATAPAGAQPARPDSTRPEHIRPEHIRKGTPYASARARLLAAGYRPFRPLVPGTELYEQHVGFRTDVAKAYPEVEACAGTGLAPCNFILSRGPDDILRVTTVGEAVGSITVSGAERLSRARAEEYYR